MYSITTPGLTRGKKSNLKIWINNKKIVLKYNSSVFLIISQFYVSPKNHQDITEAILTITITLHEKINQKSVSMSKRVTSNDALD